eukprot:GAHX01002290.1.p1 GENE.GAHX01002290.1~~GAHX01002290.1.p1  ORF type:complete len:331 (-),score=52.48 GAHX01002290.1:469-1461(-)
MPRKRSKKITPQQPNYEPSFQLNKIRTFCNSENETDPINLLKSNFYIDKTKLYLKLIYSNEKAVFIRPRGFGKTTALNFLKLIFQGTDSKEHFKGTYIYDQPMINCHGEYIDKNMQRIKDNDALAIKKRVKYKWPKYPVIFFDFEKIASTDFKESNLRMLETIYNTACQYGVEHKMESPKDARDMVMYLEHLINNLTRLGNDYENKVVVLVDEFDAMLRDCNLNPKSKEDKRERLELMREFHNVLKARNEKIKMKFITGSTTISFTDLFMWSPDIHDISFLSRYSTLVGFTRQEIENTIDYSMFERLAVSITGNKNIASTKSKSYKTCYR